METIKRHPWMLLIPVLWLSTWLAARMLNYDAIWFDERMVYWITGSGLYEPHSIVETMYRTAIDNSWPPAYFLIFLIYEPLFGGNLFLDRLSALFIGLITIAIVYQLGRSLLSSKHGIIAATLVGTSAFALFYMHELRGYSLYILGTSLHAWFYWLCRDETQFKKRWVRWGFVLSTTFALLTHYIAAASVLGIALYHVLFGRNQPNFRRILLLGINGCLLFSPWIGVTVVSVANETLLRRSEDIGTLLYGVLYGFTNNLLIIIIPVLIISASQLKQSATRFLWVWGATILGFALISNIWIDFFFHPRHVMSIISIFALLIAAVTIELDRKYQINWVAMIVIGLWVGAGAVYSADNEFMNAIKRHESVPTQASIHSAVEIAETCASADDMLLFAVERPRDQWIHDIVLRLYFPDFDKAPLGHVITDEFVELSNLLPDELQEEPIENRLQFVTENREKIWLFSLPEMPIQDDIAALSSWMTAQSFTYCEVADTPDLFAAVYTQSDQTCEQIVQSCQP